MEDKCRRRLTAAVSSSTSSTSSSSLSWSPSRQRIHPRQVNLTLNFTVHTQWRQHGGGRGGGGRRGSSIIMAPAIKIASGFVIMSEGRARRRRTRVGRVAAPPRLRSGTTRRRRGSAHRSGEEIDDFLGYCAYELSMGLRREAISP